MMTNIVVALLFTQSSSPTTPVSTSAEAQICAEAMQGMSANPPIPYGVTEAELDPSCNQSVLVALPDGTAHSTNPQVLLNLQICKPSLTTPNVMIDQVTGEETPASSDLSNMATVQTSNFPSTYAAASNSQTSTVWVPEDEYLLPNSETGPWRRVS